MTVDAAKRTAIGQQILDICAGHETETTLMAQADAMASSIGAMHFMVKSNTAQALAVLDEMHRQMRDHIKSNWGKIELGSVQ
jgi:hypothetical protein